MCYKDAFSCYGRALEIAPSRIVAWCGKDFALDQLRRFEESIAC